MEERQRMIWSRFSAWLGKSQVTAYRPVYADMCAEPGKPNSADAVAGLMLAQIVYWYLLPTSSGADKTRIERDGHKWIARRHQDWYEELRIRSKQADAKLRRLERLGLIERKLYKFAGSPTLHIRIVRDVFLERWYDLVPDALPGDLPQLGKSIYPSEVKQNGAAPAEAGALAIVQAATGDLPQLGKSIYPSEVKGAKKGDPFYPSEAKPSIYPSEAIPYTERDNDPDLSIAISPDLLDIWAEALEQLELTLPKATYAQHLKGCQVAGIDGQGRLRLRPAAAFSAEWINSRQLAKPMQRAISQASSGAIQGYIAEENNER